MHPPRSQCERYLHHDNVQFLVDILTRLATAAVVLVGFEGLYRFVHVLIPNVQSSATVGSGGVCVVASWTV
eukprot:scaffold111204_cov51-Attheya_sp.AAC.1